MSFSKQITIENIFLLQGMNSEAARRVPKSQLSSFGVTYQKTIKLEECMNQPL
jgi:hypothetical protein